MAATKLATKSLVRAAAIAGRQTGIGFAVTNKALAANVATLTTAAAHDFIVGDVVEVRGVDAVFDGRQTITAIGATAFSFAKTAADIASTPVSPQGCASKRLAIGERRFAGAENLESLVAGLSAETQGYMFLRIKRLAVSENEIASLRLAGKLLVHAGKDDTSDLLAAWDFAIGVAEALAASANYSAANGEIRPESVNVVLSRIDVVKSRGIAVFDFGDGGEGGVEIGNV